MKVSATSQHALRNSLVGLAPLGASCLWGGMYVVSKASFESIPPITLGLFRLLIGSITLSLFLWLSRKVKASSTLSALSASPTPSTLPPNARQRLPFLGACISATIITQFLGTSLATAHEGALLTTITPVCIIPIAWFMLRERPSIRVILGMMIALAGVVLVIGIQGSGSSQGASWLGDALLLISSCTWAMFTVAGTPLVRVSSALIVSTYATLWSLVFFAPFAIWELLHHPLPRVSWGNVGSILYLGIGATALAWFLWYKGVERLPASVASVFFFAQPVVGSLLGALLLHESLSSSFWIGGCVLAAGILLVSWKG